MNRIWCILIIAQCLIGCTTSNSRPIQKEGIFSPVQNEVVINKPIKEVWIKLVSLMQDPFFNVREMNEVSYIVKFNFFTNNACNYADCKVAGMDPKTISSNNDFGNQFSRDACGQSKFIYQVQKTEEGGFKYVNRVVSNDIFTYIEGNAVVSMIEQNGKTIVSINVDYDFSINIDQEMTEFDKTGKQTNNYHVYTTDKCKFTTMRGNQCNDLKQVTCFSNGVLEKVFLDYIK